ncbi:MAG: phosphopantothenoylcysteine decarboxylase [Candidatus Nealsonbacteria bacterium]|nr:phosphopantothenoylcysteine decarboxylase [Candidatus Nealsonbacteria bacterium]
MNGRELLVGVTGGIAAYKTAALVSKLVQAGAGVSVVMTRSATKLVGPKTFEALTGRPVLTKVFGAIAPGREGPGTHPHIELADAAELLCVAPATANLLAKAAVGLADDLLSTLLLSFDGPVVMAPAMNTRMWEKPAVQRNVEQLRADGVVLIDPEDGYLSCGTRGPGRMASPEKIFEMIAEEMTNGEMTKHE